MDNFNLKKYLAEGKLKENFEKCNFTENDIDEMQETAFMAGWNLGQKGVGKGSLYSSAESAFRIWNSDSMEDLAKNKLEEGKINIKPQLDVNHHIVFKNPDAASRKLYNAGVDFENVGFLFPKMSYETWETIKELFSNDEIGDMGQI